MRRVLATINYGWILSDVMSWGRPQFAPPVVKDPAALEERDLDSGAPGDVVEENTAELLDALVCNDFPSDVAGNVKLLCGVLDRGQLRPNTLWRLAAELELDAAAEAASPA